jgi:hypothetical protein
MLKYDRNNNESVHYELNYDKDKNSFTTCRRKVSNKAVVEVESGSIMDELRQMITDIKNNGKHKKSQ